ncbi:MAG: hypothetical protein RSA97_06040 [Oscillospiraceae bacterium]
MANSLCAVCSLDAVARHGEAIMQSFVFVTDTAIHLSPLFFCVAACYNNGNFHNSK